MPIYTKVFLCISLNRPRKNMEIRRWNIDSFDQLQERITGAVEQKKLLVEADKKDIQDEDKKKKMTVAPVDSLVVQYFDSEHWITIASEEEFLEALRVMSHINQELMTLRVGPSKVWKKGCLGKGHRMGHRIAAGHGHCWWIRRMAAAREAQAESATTTSTAAEEHTADESTDEEEMSANELPRGVPQFGLMKMRARRHHRRCHEIRRKEKIEKEGGDVQQERALPHPRCSRKRQEGNPHCRGGRIWKKWLERHQKRLAKIKEEANVVEQQVAEPVPEEHEAVSVPMEQEIQEAPAHAEPLTQYADAHQALQSMGFSYWKLNEHLLRHHRGNVAAVVSALIKLSTC